MNINIKEQINRITNRFEIAVSNFGRSCIDMQANEKAFHAWYAAGIIQEFGLAHVYREIHLLKSELFELAPPNELTKDFVKGNELFPDVSISWLPNVDARHSSTRTVRFRNAGSLLSEFSIVSELKVTGSTSNPTQPNAIQTDISKLYLFSQAHKKVSQVNEKNFPLKCYMVILDNAKDRHEKFKGSYTKSKIEKIVTSASNDWRNDIQKPCIVLISPGINSANVFILRNFSEWVDMQ